FFLRFGACKTLGGIGLAIKNFVIPPQKILLVLYGFYRIGHRHWEFRHLRDRRLVAAGNRGFKFVPECRKFVCAATGSPFAARMEKPLLVEHATIAATVENDLMVLRLRVDVDFPRAKIDLVELCRVKIPNGVKLCRPMQ